MKFFKNLPFLTVFDKLNWYFSKFIYSFTGIVDWTLTPEVKGGVGGLICTYFFSPCFSLWFRKLNLLKVLNNNKLELQKQRFANRWLVALIRYFDPIFVSCQNLHTSIYILKIYAIKCVGYAVTIGGNANTRLFFHFVTMWTQHSMISLCYFSNQLFKTIHKVLNIMREAHRKARCSAKLSLF